MKKYSAQISPAVRTYSIYEESTGIKVVLLSYGPISMSRMYYHFRRLTSLPRSSIASCCPLTIDELHLRSGSSAHQIAARTSDESLGSVLVTNALYRRGKFKNGERFGYVICKSRCKSTLNFALGCVTRYSDNRDMCCSRILS